MVKFVMLFVLLMQIKVVNVVFMGDDGTTKSSGVKHNVLGVCIIIKARTDMGWLRDLLFDTFAISLQS